MNEIIESAPHQVAAQPLPADSPMGMMIAALSQGASLDQVSQMMDLQERWNKQQAKKLYDAAFAAFKAESIQIIKGRKVTDGPLKGRSYAELHDVVSAVTPALSKHGLSSSWRLTQDEKDWIQVTCYLRHTGGHEESVSMGGPPDTGGAKNALQARASTKTYLERYTLKAITGLSEQDDDTDGQAPAKGAAERDHWISEVAKAETLAEVDQIWRDGCAAIQATNDLSAFAAFKKAVGEKRNMLKEA